MLRVPPTATILTHSFPARRAAVLAPAARGQRDARGRGLPRPGRDRRTQRRHAGKAWARRLATIVPPRRLTHCPCRSGLSRELCRPPGGRQTLRVRPEPPKEVRRTR